VDLFERVREHFQGGSYRGAMRRMESGGVWIRLDEIGNWSQGAIVAHMRRRGLDAHVHTWADEWGRGGVIVVRGELRRAPP
jgi:hypothetical protein